MQSLTCQYCNLVFHTQTWKKIPIESIFQSEKQVGPQLLYGIRPGCGGGFPKDLSVYSPSSHLTNTQQHSEQQGHDESCYCSCLCSLGSLIMFCRTIRKVFILRASPSCHGFATSVLSPKGELLFFSYCRSLVKCSGL